MSVELLKTLSTFFYIGAVLFLSFSILLFYVLDIPNLFGDLSGRSAKKMIDAIRRQNETMEDSFDTNVLIYRNEARTDKRRDRFILEKELSFMGSSEIIE